MRLDFNGTPDKLRKVAQPFPLMSELPALLDTSGWSWAIFEAPAHGSDGFWVGTDLHGHKWLTKLRGSFYAYREMVFARLAQRMGWSCQSSIFIRLDQDSAHCLQREVGEVHAAHWFIEEHVYPPCGPECALLPLVGREIQSPDDLHFSGIGGLLDWPKSEIAAYIFGGNEPPGRLFTVAHEFAIIDSEQMFSTGPCVFDDSPWLRYPDGSPSVAGKALAITVCREIGNLSSDDLTAALAIPHAINIDLRWPIAPKVHASVKFAAAYHRANK